MEIEPSLDMKFKSFFWRMDKSILGLFLFLFIGVFLIWNSFDHYNSFWEQSVDIFTFCIALVVSFVIAFINLYLIDCITDGKLNNLNWSQFRFRWNEFTKIFKGEKAIILLVLFQSINFFLTVFYPSYYFVWISILPIVLLLAFLSKYFRSNNKTLFLVLSNLLISISVFCIMNFRVIGVYFYWNLTGSDCFINYGYKQKGDPLEQIEFLDNIEDWERFGNLLPGAESSLEFITHGFLNTFIFYLYPILFVILLFNSHYIFWRLLYRNYFLKQNNIL